MLRRRRSQQISRATWETLAREDPWRAVLTNVDGRAAAGDAQAREDFYRSGDEHVTRIFGAIESHFGRVDFDTGADFGCGVGRIVIPLARRCREAIGIDIAPTMLSIAAQRAREEGVRNLSLQDTQEFFSDPRPIDLFHSFLVFQHIWPDDGMQILRRVLPRLRAGGMVVLHVPYWVGGKPPRLPFRWARTHIPGFNAVANLVRGVPAATPFMQMNAYDLGAIAGLLHDEGCDDLVLLREREAEAHSVIVIGRITTARLPTDHKSTARCDR